MADAFRSKVDEAYKNITAEDLQDVAGVEGTVKGRVDVPEEREFAGFDAYKKARNAGLERFAKGTPKCRWDLSLCSAGGF